MTKQSVGVSKAQKGLRTRVKESLKALDLRHKDLAEVLGVSQAGISQRLNGSQWFTDSEVAATAVYLRKTVDELMEGSYYRHQSHQAWLDAEKVKADERRRVEAERKTAGRAICCDCGTVRLAGSKWKQITGRPVYENEGRRGRMTGLLDCETCDKRTRHAVLREPNEHRDYAEEWQNTPTADDEARTEVDNLVARIRGFNILVEYKVLGDPDYNLKIGYAPCVAIRYLESKQQWRVRINPNYPPMVQRDSLQEVWEVIAMDNQEWWEGMQGPTGGAYYNQNNWTDTIDGLVSEIHRAAPAVLHKTALDIADREHDSESEDA